MLLILLVANGILPGQIIKPRCASPGCNTIVKNWGEYCYWHKSNHKTNWSTNFASTSQKTRTYESSESSSDNDSSTENSSGTSSQNASNRWKSDDNKYYSYDEGYEWDARKMIIDSSKGISERKNAKEFYRRCNSGQYFKKKEK